MRCTRRAYLRRNFAWLFATPNTNATVGQAYVYADGPLGQYNLLGEYGNGGFATDSTPGQAEYLWLPTEQGAQLVGIYKDAQLLSVHTDHLGTPRLVKDRQNAPAWQWAYSAFGDNLPLGAYTKMMYTPAAGAAPVIRYRSQPAQMTMNLRFPGQYWDDESKLSYNYFRSYSPGQGRYSQSDPIGLGGGWSRFGYVNQDALNHADPLGLDVMSTIADRVAGIPYGRPGDQYDTTFTITKRGACEGSRDPMCAAGMAAAGLQGPYYSETKTYSSMCVLGLGVGVKGGGAVAGNAIANQVPRVASQLGVGARSMSLIGRGIAIFTNPATAAASIGYAVGPLLEQCEVKPPICEAK